MYDFNKLFSDYVLSKGHVHEDELNEVYEQWYARQDASLGTSPKQLIESMSDGELISELKDECSAGAPSLTVMENLEKRAPQEQLTSLLYEDNPTLVYCAAEVLRNIGKAPLEAFAVMLPSAPDDLLDDILVSSLKEDPDSVRDVLLEIAEKADLKTQTVIAEILAEGGKDERVYQLLTKLFASGDNAALYSGYLARYGDERAVAMLYRALATASYADFIEIRNAIEVLGGIVDDDRDFSSDPEYILIKENGSANK